MFSNLRVAAAAAIALTAVGATAIAVLGPTTAMSDDFTSGLQRPFQLAGGGGAPAVTGAAAARVSLSVNDIVPLPDGRTLVSLTEPPRPGASNLVMIGRDGRLESFPFGPGEAGALDLEPAGTVVATTMFSTRLSRIFPAERRVQVIADKARASGLSARERAETLSDVAVLPDGTFAVADGNTAFRVAADGTFTRAYPKGTDAPFLVESVAALPGGAFALFNSNTAEVTRVGPDGTLRRLVETAPSVVAIAAAPGGGLLVLDANGLRHLDSGGTPTRISGEDGGLAGPPLAFGLGDGAPLARAPLGAGRALAVAPDGAVLAATENGIRVLVGADSPRRLVALEQSGYLALRDGRSPRVVTTMAGRVVLRVRSRGKTIVSAPVDLPAGGGEVPLAPLPARGAMRVEISLTDAAGAEAVARTTVDTRRRLTLGMAHRAIDAQIHGAGEGDESASVTPRRGRCLRKSAVRIDCRALEAYTIYADPPYTPKTTTSLKCDGRYVVRLRPDGIRLDGDQRCGAL